MTIAGPKVVRDVCPSCDHSSFPAEFFADGRQHEGHFSVRFGDHSAHHIENVTANAQDVRDRAKECMAGESGWVVVHTDPLQRCPTCLADVLCDIHYGHVSVSVRPRSI